MAGSVSISLILSFDPILDNAKGVIKEETHLLTVRTRYGEDKELTEDYQKDIWEFGY